MKIIKIERFTFKNKEEIDKAINVINESKFKIRRCKYKKFLKEIH
jgi:hypothetical protein